MFGYGGSGGVGLGEGRLRFGSQPTARPLTAEKDQRKRSTRTILWCPGWTPLHCLKKSPDTQTGWCRYFEIQTTDAKTKTPSAPAPGLIAVARHLRAARPGGAAPPGVGRCDAREHDLPGVRRLPGAVLDLCALEDLFVDSARGEE